MPTTPPLADELAAPPLREARLSTCKVYTILRSGGAHTQHQLQQKANLHEETVRQALDQLRAYDLLVEFPATDTPSRYAYRVDASALYPLATPA